MILIGKTLTFLIGHAVVVLCSNFRTIFVFALESFLPMKVIFFDYNGNFNGKMDKIKKMAKNHFSRSDLGS